MAREWDVTLGNSHKKGTVKWGENQQDSQLRSPPKLKAEDSEDMQIRTTMQQSNTQGYPYLIILNTYVSENVLNSGGTGEEKKETRTLNKIIPEKNKYSKRNKEYVLNINLGCGQEMSCWGSTTLVESWTARKSHLCRCTRKKHLAKGTAQTLFLRGKTPSHSPRLGQTPLSHYLSSIVLPQFVIAIW